MNTAQSERRPAPRPWWSFAHVWMLISGPAVVVVASLITYGIAARSPDPVLSTPSTADSEHRPGEGISQAPAVQARNHAATGELPSKVTQP